MALGGGICVTLNDTFLVFKETIKKGEFLNYLQYIGLSIYHNSNLGKLLYCKESCNVNSISNRLFTIAIVFKPRHFHSKLICLGTTIRMYMFLHPMHFTKISGF